MNGAVTVPPGSFAVEEAFDLLAEVEDLASRLATALTGDLDTAVAGPLRALAEECDIAAREAESAVLRIVRDPAGESGRIRELRELCARVIARIQHEARALRAAGVDAPAALGGLATLETA